MPQLVLLLAGLAVILVGVFTSKKILPTLVGLAMVLGIVAVGTAGVTIARQTGPPQADTFTQPVLSHANDDTTALGSAFDSFVTTVSDNAAAIVTAASETYTQVQDDLAAVMYLDIGMLFLAIGAIALMAVHRAARRDEDFAFLMRDSFYQTMVNTVEDLTTRLRQLFGNTTDASSRVNSTRAGWKGSLGPVITGDRAGTFAFG